MSFTLSEESEAELRPNELVCPITNLTYNRGLGQSPHFYVHEDGRVIRT